MRLFSRYSLVSRTVTIAIIAGLAVPMLNAAATRETKQPNILLVVADDLGTQLGCYGDPIARTPEIDKFARQSVRFETAYVAQSSCSPSRAALLTGLFPHQTGQIGLANRGYTMSDGIDTLPAMLKTAHYRTGIIGKLHVLPESAFPFDYAEKSTVEARDVKLVAERAAKFWSESKGQPWFLMVNYFDPHTPFFAQRNGLPATPQTAAEMRPFSFQGIDAPDVREHMAGYYNGVARVDAGLGLLLAQLEATGQAGDTLIVFMGDNGAPFVRAKTNGTEAGLRVPFIVRWPRGARVGEVSPALVSGVDLVPTFRAVAGLPAIPALNGRSFLDVLENKIAKGRDYLFAEHNAHRRDMYFPQRIVRDGRFKYVLNLKAERDFGIEVDEDPAHRALTNPAWANTRAQAALQFLRHPPAEELYDLQADPDEYTNLAAQPEHRATLERMRAALQSWRETTQDPLLDPAKRAEELAQHSATTAAP